MEYNRIVQTVVETPTYLATANKLAKQGKTRRADLVYQRAEADARVAQAVALDSTVSAQARAIDEQISALRGALPESP